MSEQHFDFDVSDSLNTLPTSPGVYKMLDVQGEVLYVGKALNLKKRVLSYFNRSTQSPKNRALISQIARVAVTITRSETEALILENSWIKLHYPKYNILLRDDKSYPFIYLSEHPVFPSISLVRRKRKPNSTHYFGPFPSVAAVHKTLHLIHKLFKIRNCSEPYFKTRSRPCLQYQIKRCTAPCVHLISPPDYQEAVTNTKRFLQGKSQQILENLSERMQIAVTQRAYEDAALLRDQIQHLRAVQEEQSVVQSHGDADVIVLEVQPGFAAVQLVQIRRGEVVASEHYFPAIPSENLDEDSVQEEDSLWQEVFHAFLTQIYFDTPERIPQNIITDRDISEQEALQTALTSLRGKNCRIKVGKRGLAKRWVAFATQNLQHTVSQYTHSKASKQSRMHLLKEWLQLPQDIHRMECFDISHFQGDATVASCVVFDEEGPLKRAYRRFDIRGVANDDYAAMAQVLMRRYQKMAQSEWPDVLIVDGGLGQVGIARRVLTQLGLVEHIAILGIAKGPARKAGQETFIFTTENPGQEVLPEHSRVRHLLQFIRDEAHRFAIQAHRKKRDKSSLSSTLESIEGVGPQRRKALLQRFGGMRDLRRASIDELKKVRGISEELAKKIYAYLQT